MESQRHIIDKTILNNNNDDNNKTAITASLKLYYRFILVLISISDEKILLERISYWGEGVCTAQSTTSANT